MKNFLSIRLPLTLMMMVIILTGCSSPKGIVFANREWHISDYYGQIIDRDTTYRMTFGNVLIPDPLVIISSSDSIAKYPGMDRFITDILHKVHLDNAEILFYAPEMLTMFVRLKEDFPPMKPSSISSPMSDERPFTMWVQEDDVENWTRKASEMYTYTYFDKGRKQLLIVDCFNYGDEPVAQIIVFQSKNRSTAKMKIPERIKRAYWYNRDMKYFMRDIEFWSAQVNFHRNIAFGNYKIGQEQKLRRK